MGFQHPDQLYDMAVAQHNERLKQARAVQAHLAEQPTRQASLPALVKWIHLLLSAGRRSVCVYSAATVRRAMQRTNA
jgi:hypothetical protein